MAIADGPFRAMDGSALDPRAHLLRRVLRRAAATTYAARPGTMRFLAKLFFRGLAAILPLALTGYLVYAAVNAGEALLHGIIKQFTDWYWPGMGFAFSIVLVMLVGLLMYSFIVRTIYRRVTALVARIPIIKSVYGMLVDVLQMFGTGDNRPFHQVVLVRLESGLEQLGFLTRPDFHDLPAIGEDKVAVYLPMSYQLGGFTVVVAKDRVREIDMKAEEALRFCVTAGVTQREQA
jgi:uncharacterized membrane protein